MIRPFIRHLSISSNCFSDASKAVASNIDAMMDPVQQWLESEGRQYKSVQLGVSNYVSKYKHTPFPMNPLFRPCPPLSDKVRDDIYRRFIASDHPDPTVSLASQFHISEARVRAIIKLKQFQQVVASKGQPLQSHFNNMMERMLQVNSHRPQLDSTNVKSIKMVPPYLLTLDEQVEFDKEDALKLIKGARQSILDKDSKSTPNPHKSAKPQIVSRDTRRGKMVFNLNAKIQQGFMKRVFKNPLKSY